MSIRFQRFRGVVSLLLEKGEEEVVVVVVGDVIVEVEVGATGVEECQRSYRVQTAGCFSRRQLMRGHRDTRRGIRTIITSLHRRLITVLALALALVPELRQDHHHQYHHHIVHSLLHPAEANTSTKHQDTAIDLVLPPRQASHQQAFIMALDRCRLITHRAAV